MKIGIITRSTLMSEKGGDTIQVLQTALWLEQLGVQADIISTNNEPDYSKYDLLHFFNIIRPADILHHIRRFKKPFVVSPVLVDYSEYDKFYRKGLPGLSFRFLSADTIEYLKAIARRIKGRDSIRSLTYLWWGHRKSIREILNKTALVLPNSTLEYERLTQLYSKTLPYITVPNGIDENLFKPDPLIKKDPNLVVCAARIEGIKNQFNLIKALNNTEFTVVIIGAPALNQMEYYRRCRNIAAKNIIFLDHLSQKELVQYYQKAKVHILPSWFETCGLSTLEAAAMGCNVVITDKGFTREYFEDFAFYCDPSSPASILEAVENAASSPATQGLQEKILNCYTWKTAARQTLKAYQKILYEE
jgi:glycosyltransferase involved in cell wall biosynthesis